MTRELKVHQGLEETSREEFGREHMLVVSGLVRPSLARAAADETSESRLFARARPLPTATGQVSTFRGSSIEDSALGVILGRISNMGKNLGLDMYPRSGTKPGAQAIEISAASDTYYYRRLGQHGIAAFIALEGGFTLGDSSKDGLLEPGTVAFLNDRGAPYHINAHNLGSTSIGLLVAGRETRPTA